MFPFSSESNSSHLGFWSGLNRFERMINIFRFINLAEMTTSRWSGVNHFEMSDVWRALHEFHEFSTNMAPACTWKNIA